jgi:hypothetical protein
VDIELILDSAEIMAPELRDITLRILTAIGQDMDLSLELADVLARQANGWPEVHITAVADELLTYLLGTRENVLGDKSTLMTLAYIGAEAIMTRAQIDEAR